MTAVCAELSPSTQPVMPVPLFKMQMFQKVICSLGALESPLILSTEDHVADLAVAFALVAVAADNFGTADLNSLCQLADYPALARFQINWPAIQEFVCGTLPAATSPFPPTPSLPGSLTIYGGPGIANNSSSVDLPGLSVFTNPLRPSSLSSSSSGLNTLPSATPNTGNSYPTITPTNEAASTTDGPSFWSSSKAAASALASTLVTETTPSIESESSTQTVSDEVAETPAMASTVSLAPHPSETPPYANTTDLGASGMDMPSISSSAIEEPSVTMIMVTVVPHPPLSFSNFPSGASPRVLGEPQDTGSSSRFEASLSMGRLPPTPSKKKRYEFFENNRVYRA